jgi:hypothetical protein
MDEKKQKTDIPDVKEALNEYFKLKRTYENKIYDNKKKIINNVTLSNREKRSEFLKLKPKCINCQRPGGTIFKIIGFEGTSTEESHREYNATCGIIADPCNLNIKIKIGKVELMPDLLNTIQKEITDTKNEIIDNKNKLLFGFLTAENVLENFEDLKENVNHFSSLYDAYLYNYNSIVDNEKKKTELDESITTYYIQIEEIKNCIKKMNETNNMQYAHDAANIYANILQPLNDKIRSLKYNETMVWHNDEFNTCNLIQTKYSISNLSYSSFEDKVVSYDVGLKANTKKKPTLIIESSESTQDDEPKEIPIDEPKYIDGGIQWKNQKYQNLWNKMPTKLKNVLMTNHEWMKEFLFNYLNTKDKSSGYPFTSPKDLKIPPQELSAGQYDFGIKIYNDEYNKLPASLKQTYMTFYSVKNGVKDYNMLKNSMNDLVAKEVGFNNGFF